MIKKNDINFLIIFQIIQIITLYKDIPAWVLCVAIATYATHYFKIKVSKFVLKTITLGAMGVVVFYYRSLFIPESAVSLLVIAGSFKILEIETKRDIFISLLISILFISAIAIFSNSLNSFIFMTTYLLVVIGFWAKIFNENNLTIKLISKYLLKIIALTLPFTILLFVFFPRFSTHFFPFRGSSEQSSVGFNDRISNSEIEGLRPSSKIAFRAIIKDTKLQQKELYWRGTVHLQTNGFDWEPNTVTNSLANIQKSQTQIPKNSEVSYKIQYNQQFKGIYFTLENVATLKTSNGVFLPLNDLRLFQTTPYTKIESYQASSILQKPNFEISKSREFNYLQLPKSIPSNIIELANLMKAQKSQTQDIVNSIGQYLQNNNFEYSLTPGRITSINQLLEVKKGFCTHYASLVAIILRILKIQTRLVSGFQGGEYNQVGDYWVIRDNDAHTWVEYFDNILGWRQFDPVEFVSPARLTSGGELYFSNQAPLLNASSNYFSSAYRYYLKIKLHLDNYNFRWQSFIESFDKSYQENLASFFKIKIEKFYIIIAIGFLFLIYFYFQLSSLKFSFFTRNNLSQEDRYYHKFIIYVAKKKNKPIVHSYSPAENIKYFGLNGQNRVEEFFKMYSDIKYGGMVEKKLKLTQIYQLAKAEINTPK